ncbi:MAG: hypothetical protein ABIH83_01725 [Candidatus Micrarchaeota archaeon]
MGKIYSMTVYHNKDILDVAEEWVQNNLCAVGYCKVDINGVQPQDVEKTIRASTRGVVKKREINELKIFKKIEFGDVVLAYMNNNHIYAIGTVDGEYRYDETNIIGKSKKDGGFGYPHQIPVKWLDSPREFHRKHLPKVISEQLGKHGKTTFQIESAYDSDEFIALIEKLQIPRNEGKFKEELVKAGLSKYVKINSEHIEKGLKIMG